MRNEITQRGKLFDPDLPAALRRGMPFELCVSVPGGDTTRVLCDAVAAIVPRIGERSYDVTVESFECVEPLKLQELRHAIANRILEEQRALGILPDYDFSQPDVVVAVEILGDTAGIALVDRSELWRYPFVHEV